MSLSPDLVKPLELITWKADNDIIDVVSFPTFGKAACNRVPTRLMTGAKRCKLWDLETRKTILTIPAQNQGTVNALEFDDKVCGSATSVLNRLANNLFSQRVEITYMGHTVRKADVYAERP